MKEVIKAICEHHRIGGYKKNRAGCVALHNHLKEAYGLSVKSYSAKKREARMNGEAREAIKARTPQIQSSESSVSEERLSAFYQSWGWKEARYLALKTHGRRCQCCGAGPNQSRIVVDHIKPLRKRWDLRLDQGNLQVLCDDCNMGKSYKDETDWRSTTAPEASDVSISEEYSAFHLGGRFH